MKATGTFPKCRPARSGTDAPAAHRPAARHMPLRRPVAILEQRCAEGGQAGAAFSSTQPIEALVLHAPAGNAPHVLHIDNDPAAALALAILLMPEARVTHVPTLAAARAILQQQIFSAVVIDPNLPDGDAVELLPALSAIPMLVYSANPPRWRMLAGVYLPKPWTSPRQLWSTISALLGIPAITCAGD